MTDRINQDERRFRALADAMPQMVWTAGSDGALDYCNRQWSRYTGLSLEQSVGWAWSSALHPDDLQYCRDRWTLAFTSGRPYEIECRFKRVSDGTYRWHLARAQPATDADGNTVKWFGTFTDIDNLRQAQHALEESFKKTEERIDARTAELTVANRKLESEVSERSHSERRIRMILESSRDAFIGMDERGFITTWNAQAEATFGWSKDEAIGLGLAQTIIPERFREAHEAGLARMLSAGTGPVLDKRLELPALHRSGTEFPVELTISAIRIADNYEFFAFLRDVSEREQARALAAEQSESLEEARAALMQSQKLEAIGKLTGGVAHDFNNVLQVIGGSLQLLQSEIADRPDAEKRVVTALDAVTRGSILSSQLLAFARRQPLEPVAINLGRIVRSMNDLLQRAIGETIQIETVVSGGLWNTCVDPSQLEHVILNLAINARDAMRDGGKLTIEIGNALLDDDYVMAQPGVSAGQYVMLALSDTGTGMSAEVKTRAFEPFFTTKPEGEGAGLGLSMAYGFVKQSGGHIRIYSESGHGTTVRIYLPRSFDQETEAPSNFSGPVEGGTETILVVEDDPAVQATVIDMLAALGYRVLKADNGENALSILKSGLPIDLMFTDVVMPGPIRSPELARQAKAIDPNIQILFTSGYTQNAIVHGGRLDPGVNLLSKPYRREQLARKIRHLLSIKPMQVPQAAAGPGVTRRNMDRAVISCRILLVEDNHDFRHLVCDMLKMLGHEVHSAATAEEAIEPVKSGTFDLLLTDVNLPGISGIDLAEIAVKNDPGIKIIFASGYGYLVADKSDFEFVLLSKPFNLAQLTKAIEQI